MFYYKEGKKTKSVKIPENLDDMDVVYNGVSIDSAHPSYDHNFDTDESYIKITDILPPNGTVTFINRNGGDVDLAVVGPDGTLAICRTGELTAVDVGGAGVCDDVLCKQRCKSLLYSRGRACAFRINGYT